MARLVPFRSVHPRARLLQHRSATGSYPPYDPLDPFAEPPPPINEAFTVRIDWEIPVDAEPGTYRVLFHGSERSVEARAASLRRGNLAIRPRGSRYERSVIGRDVQIPPDQRS